jgi:hypothetical protein
MPSKKDDSAPASRFVGAGAFRVVDLEFPVEFDGKVYDKITVRRMTMREMRAFVEGAANGDGSIMTPNIDCPLGLLDELDPDDFEKVNKAVEDFLPRALKAAIERAGEAGEPTPPSSPPSSDGGPTSSSDSSGTTPSLGSNTP